ncbi:MAG TPA: hypothetical protein VD997_02340 [Phycisphaerales bacterium]|nr:hypothetical protein [Phycisphaerales bacterium]
MIELIRPMADADKPVTDPEGKGRKFSRKHSVFAGGGSSSSGGHVHTGSCACGKPGGGCGRP